MSNPKTQKACGIMRGLSQFMYENNYSLQLGTLEHLLIQKQQDIDHISEHSYFARPCPITPRHGFIESRLVYTKSEIRTLLEEVLKEDPDGELLLGRAIQFVSYNAILTTFGTLSIGPGNDGATSGKGAVQFPVAPTNLSPLCIERSKLGPDDAGYFELIYASTTDSKKDPVYASLVQLRGGPATSQTDMDYIPAATTVSNVIIPSDDLLAWAKQVESLTPGTVVWGAGHTLSSHAAVHCVLHKIPFITTYEPLVGQRIEPLSGSKQNTIFTDDFRRGFAAGMNHTVANATNYMKNSFMFSLSVLHNWAYLRNSEHAGVLLGAALSTMSKLCAAVILGEFRHADRSPYSGLERDELYVDAYKSNTSLYVSKMDAAFDSFLNDHWRSGFGGAPWALCAHYSINLWNSIVNIFKSKESSISDEGIASVMDTFNTMINLSHNNGWWFNKIADVSVMTAAAKAPALIAAACAKTYVEILEGAKSASKKSIKPIVHKSPYFEDPRLGSCCMSISKDRPDWIVFSTQKGLRRATRLNHTVAQREELIKLIADRGRIHLVATPEGTFKLANQVFHPPLKLGA